MASIMKDGNASVTTAGTRVPLKSAKTMANWLLIQTKAANTGVIYLGGETVTATSGVILSSGDSDVVWPMMAFNCYDLNKIFVDAATSGDGVQYIYTSI